MFAMSSTRLSFGAVAVALALGAAPSVASPAQGFALEAAPGAFGQHLTDGQGRSIYMFARDRGARGSTCTGACASVWPPVLAPSHPVLGAQLDMHRLGWVQRPDGRHQLTYGGWPLYYYAPDRPGEARGQAVDQFGGRWYLLAPSGQVIRQPARGGE